MVEFWFGEYGVLAVLFLALILFGYLCRRLYSRRQVRMRERLDLARREGGVEAREASAVYERELVAKNIDMERQLERVRGDLAVVAAELESKQLHAESIEAKEVTLEVKLKEADESLVVLENLKQLYRLRLMEVAGLDEGETKAALFAEAREEVQEDLQVLRRDLLGRSHEAFEAEAKRILLNAMVRLSLDSLSSTTANMVKIPSEEIKGRLIGKEGRNIRTFEMACGVTLLIDETPGMVFVSSFDPVRREIGRLALEALVEDGRIHPTTIEEAVARYSRQIVEEVKRAGQGVVERLKLKSVPGEVAELLGRLKYHHSNNQNTLEHSVEVSHLCGLIASELKLDVQLAKRCGLFHDIGKAMSCEEGGSHSWVAGDLLRRLGEDSVVVNAVQASHEEVVSESLYAEVLKIADRVSATRPGARSESIEGYIQRVQALESIAKGFEGVNDAYSIQAGREVRVIVSPEIYSDSEALVLAGRIREQIEAEIKYPGKVVVTVIRESRFVEVAV